MTSRPGAGDLRVSDAERELAVADLKEHCAAGRLTLDELPDRVARAYCAKTFGDLADLMADLPAPPVPAPRARRRRSQPRTPGILPFAEIVEFSRAADSVFAEVLTQIAPALSRYGYELVEHDHRKLGFERWERPAWTILAAIVLFPLGLLFLLYRRSTRIQLTVQPFGPGRSRVLVHGSAPLTVRRTFTQLGP